MSLLGDTVQHLTAGAVDTAVIGGLALAAHGVARATLDADLLVVDRRVLEEAFWKGLAGSASLRIVRGDADDPLAGVVRLADEAEAVDVIVGRFEWQRAAIDRRMTVSVGDEVVPVVQRADLVVLKLFAGGPQDQLDVRLLHAADPDGLSREMDSVLSALPTELRRAWVAIRDAR
jgi:hypothetical protein